MEVLKGQVKKALVDDDTRRRGKKKKKDVGNVHQLKKSAKMRKCRKKLLKKKIFCQNRAVHTDAKKLKKGFF